MSEHENENEAAEIMATSAEISAHDTLATRVRMVSSVPDTAELEELRMRSILRANEYLNAIKIGIDEINTMPVDELEKKLPYSFKEFYLLMNAYSALYNFAAMAVLTSDDPASRSVHTHLLADFLSRHDPGVKVGDNPVNIEKWLKKHKRGYGALAEAGERAGAPPDTAFAREITAPITLSPSIKAISTDNAENT